MDDNQNNNNNEEGEYEEVEVEYEEFDEEEDEKSEEKEKEKEKKREKKNNKERHVNNMKITNDDFNFDNNRDMKDVKLRIINEKRENNRDKLSRVTSEKYSKNSLENSSSKKTVKEEKNAIESDSNISKSVKVKLIGLNNNKYIVKGKNEKMEKDYEQLKLSKDIYINEIMKLRNELDIANTKLIKELKEKNNLLRLYEEMSSRLNSSNFKTFNEKDKIKNKSKITSSKNYFEEDLLKLLELKEK